MEYRDRGDLPAVPGSDSRESWGLQRHLEYRQGALEGDVVKLAAQINGDNGLKERLMLLHILTDQRHKATMCIGKWIAGVLAVLFAGLCYWVITETWQTRDTVKHLLTRPLLQQGPGGK